MRGFYRFHIMDPVRFESDMKVTIQQIGIANNGLFERQDDVSSVAYWYQIGSDNIVPEFPSRKYREPR